MDNTVFDILNAVITLKSVIHERMSKKNLNLKLMKKDN